MIDKEFEERLRLLQSNPHHRNFTISIDFDDTIVEGAFPGIGKLKKRC